MMRGKLIYLTLLALVTDLATGTATAKLVAYYPLNEGTGTTTSDASGNGHDGTIEGTPTWVDPQDWTINGVMNLTLFFRGNDTTQPGNSQDDVHRGR